MEIRDLILSASNKSWKMATTHGTEYDRVYKNSKGSPAKQYEVFNAVWARDKNKCYYCNFESKKHQEIHHLNDEHEDYSMDNLVTVCPLCHQSFHLDTLSSINGGKIIWLPEFTQQELNYICRALFIAMTDMDEKEDAKQEPIAFTKIARMIEDSLSNRSLIVEQHFQTGASEPAVFASALINMKPDDYERRFVFLKPFKVLPVRARFPIQVKYWKNNTFKDLPVETWEKLVIMADQ